MPNTLDLDNDESHELTELLEQAFDIKFVSEEIENIDTVGELFDIIVRDVAAPADSKKCAGSMAFYRLRRALRTLQPETSLTPSTGLTGFNGISVKRLFETLRQSTALNTPNPALSWIGVLGAVLFFSSLAGLLPFALLVDHHRLDANWGWAIPAGFVFGYIIIRIDPGRLPEDCTTLGGLANRMARLSYGRLVRLGAHADEKTLWNEFTELLCEHSRLPKKDIQRDTVFFRYQLKSA